jgi:ATP-dependent DNA helicase RecQ
LEKLFLEVDVLAVLPTGYGKSLIYHLLPLMLLARKMLEVNPTLPPVCLRYVTSVLLVISPLNSLISDQVQKLSATGLQVSALNIFPIALSEENEDFDCDVTELDKRKKLVNGYYNLLFAHPEAFMFKFGRGLVHSVVYINKTCVL